MNIPDQAQNVAKSAFSGSGVEQRMAASTINRQGATQIAPSRGKGSSQFAQFCGLYHQRLDALTLAKQLIHMIKAVQRHRGMSMGTLGGNEQFREELARLQVQLERRLELLEAFSERSTELLSPRDKENLSNAWLTISRDWQEDAVIDNYELHCHLIEQLLSMVAALGKQLELPTSQSMPEITEEKIIHAEETVYPNRFKYLEVLHFSTRLMPAVAEQIGRIRALATYASAMGYCDKDFASKLRYVIQCTRVNNEKLRHQTKRLESLLDSDLSMLSQLKSYEIKLEFLLTMVESDVVNAHQINTDSSRLFILATDIIDVYLKVVDEGVHLLTQWHEQDIEVWVQSY
jgi:hypothetical protein